MISVAEALDRLFALTQPLGCEDVPLRHAAGRVLHDDAIALRDQPPFDAATMDGYAIRAADLRQGGTLQVIGEAAAGHRYDHDLKPGTALRIFTGAPVPSGADQVIIQENVTRTGDIITLDDLGDRKPNIRPAGLDFKTGDRLSAPRRLTSAEIALLAAMNQPRVCVSRRPEVALISTGDELVLPGETPGPDQIVASNTYGLAALFEAHGAVVRMLPIARDNHDALTAVLSLAEGADLIVTIGGASVGDHDLVGSVAAKMGLKQDFYKVAMRPGKPLMAGTLGNAMMIGLPGNPVSAMVCGHIFVLPVLDAMQGLPARARTRRHAPLLTALEANGPREHYLRACVAEEGITAFSNQDSSLLGFLAEANALLIRTPNAAAAKPGTRVAYISLN